MDVFFGVNTGFAKGALQEAGLIGGDSLSVAISNSVYPTNGLRGDSSWRSYASTYVSSHKTDPAVIKPDC
jgi:hypothetical protein